MGKGSAKAFQSKSLDSGRRKQWPKTSEGKYIQNGNQMKSVYVMNSCKLNIDEAERVFKGRGYWRQ
jgi:hypothetical protein